MSMTEKEDLNSDKVTLANDKIIDQMINTELPHLFKLMKGSIILNLVYEYLIKILSGKAGEIDFFKDKNNIKFLTIGICLFMASSLIGLMSYFLFYVMFFFSSLKCILWLFEHYNPDTTSDENVDKISKHYVTEKSPIDVLEYYIVPIFIVLVMHPLAYVPIPFASLFVHGSSVMLGLATMTNKGYRQKFCVFIRDLFTNRDSRDANGNYIPGHEGEMHKLLQTLCYSIECINLSTFHITHNPRATYDKLNNSKGLTHGLQIMTSGIDMNQRTQTKNVDKKKTPLEPQESKTIQSKSLQTDRTDSSDRSQKPIYRKQVNDRNKRSNTHNSSSIPSIGTSEFDDDELDEY